MKSKIYTKTLLAIMACYALWSCEEFLDVEAPNHKIVSETVFNNDETAISTMTGIYNELFRASYAGGGRETSIHVLAGLAADELKNLNPNNLNLLEFEENTIQPNNSRNLSIWSSTYNIIYMTNSILEGITISESLTKEVKSNLEGEAKFIRAFTYFYLVNLYGEVPLILTTDYNENSLASANSTDEIYDQITQDLTKAIDLLKVTYREDDRTHINKSAAEALLARVHLFLGNWVEAERLSSNVIAQTDTYELKDDLNQVFLANSKEAIWQISPIGGSGGILTYTNEGTTFIFHPVLASLTKVALTTEIVETFEEQDKRLLNWVGYHEDTDNYYPFKYKDRSSMGNITEYSMVLRLAEQYLIRAEARLMQNNLEGAISDLDKIRARAGLELISNTDPNIRKDELSMLIWEEKRKEFFTEWGHRWLNLKRTERALSVLSEKTSGWDSMDVLFPIPAEELMKNPNLNQNPGY
ncbi:RagB/SusD domain-containing protein [Salegentibacter echinorum]|uniref:RagB/SusD domain-containing protein n=1 Tax=Salegentibacter echinorum TaxID=1073325 RepID=A0A1M5JHU3_SALEC|nr:RagB/SusD family nutrient uptake outer membrane protein [Salegentibacter echinorum]SHG40117.1 RagB/SusD domain-containing protein [Salegentibacter echinorum]